MPGIRLPMSVVALHFHQEMPVTVLLCQRSFNLKWFSQKYNVSQALLAVIFYWTYQTFFSFYRKLYLALAAADIVIASSKATQNHRQLLEGPTDTSQAMASGNVCPALTGNIIPLDLHHGISETEPPNLFVQEFLLQAIAYDREFTLLAYI